MERDVKKEKAQRGRERRRHEEALAVESGVFAGGKGPNWQRE
jgi:hypothetical protein